MGPFFQACDLHPEVLERRRAREAKAIAAMQAQMAAALAANPTLAEVPESCHVCQPVNPESLGIKNHTYILIYFYIFLYTLHVYTFLYTYIYIYINYIYDTCICFWVSCIYLFCICLSIEMCDIVFGSCFVNPWSIDDDYFAGLKTFNVHIHSMDIHPPPRDVPLSTLLCWEDLHREPAKDVAERRGDFIRVRVLAQSVRT